MLKAALEMSRVIERARRWRDINKKCQFKLAAPLKSLSAFPYMKSSLKYFNH
jgi:hypothetical protein